MDLTFLKRCIIKHIAAPGARGIVRRYKMPEIRQRIISCPKGHYYDANKYASCPVCSGAVFSEADDPFASVGDIKDMTVEDSAQMPEMMPIAEDGNATVAMDAPARIYGGENPPCVGWVVIITGHERGKDFRLHNGYNYIGRRVGDIIIKDPAISAENDSSISYAWQTKKYYVSHEYGKNMVFLNGRPVSGQGAELKDHDIITVGTTKLMFIGFCGEKFSWEDENA